MENVRTLILNKFVLSVALFSPPLILSSFRFRYLWNF